MLVFKASTFYNFEIFEQYCKFGLEIFVIQCMSKLYTSKVETTVVQLSDACRFICHTNENIVCLLWNRYNV